MDKICEIIMRKYSTFFNYLILLLLNFSQSYATTFQIENISLNQKIYEYFKNLDEHVISFDYPDKKYASIALQKRHINFKTYDFVQIYFEWKDENKLIKSINGAQEINSYDNCIKKKDNVTNEIYTAFVDDIKDIENIKDKKVIGGIYSTNQFFLKNGNLIKIQCYDFKDDPSVKLGNQPRFIFNVGIDSKDVLNWYDTKPEEIIDKDKLNEFQLENYTVNDSLLNYIPKEKIESYNKTNLIGNSKIYGFRTYENLDMYNEVVIYLEHGDEDYKIVALRGMKRFSSMEKCLKEKNELFEYLLIYLNRISNRALRLPIQDDVNSKGKKFKYITDYFMYKNNDEINITCEKKLKSLETYFDVGFYTPELRGISD